MTYQPPIDAAEYGAIDTLLAVAAVTDRSIWMGRDGVAEPSYSRSIFSPLAPARSTLAATAGVYETT